MLTLTKAPENWEILQQTDGSATFTVAGTFDPADPTNAILYVGVVSEDDTAPVIDWVRADTDGDSFFASLTVPTGGLYRLEVRSAESDRVSPTEAKLRAARHHIGVGDNYLIAGQSNASGVGKGYAEDAADPMVHVLRDRAYWDIATHPLDSNRCRTNPWLSFAKYLRKKLGYPIGLIPTAVAGSQIRLWLPEEDGIYYREMCEVVNSRGIGLRGMIWYQGCSEAMDGFGATYYDKLSSFISQARRDLGHPALPILSVQINRHIDGKESPEVHLSWSQVREAQRQAARTIPGFYLTTAFDSILSDGIHNGPATNPMLGQRVARMALYHLYGIGPAFDAPDIEDAVLTAPDKITLRFSHLHTLLTFGLSPADIPFRVEDAEGVVPLASYACANEYVYLTLARAVNGAATVSGMYGRENPYFLMDSGSRIPMLAFLGQKVRTE